MHLWDQQPKEPDKWYARFHQFCMAGPQRSMLMIYNAEREKKGQKPASTVTEYWRKYSRQFDWHTRALAWDEHKRREKLKAIERDGERAAELRRISIQALQSMMGRIITSEKDRQKWDPKDFKDLVQAAATIFKESRLEFGDPTEIEQIRITGTLNERTDDPRNDRVTTILDAARARRDREASGG